MSFSIVRSYSHNLFQIKADASPEEIKSIYEDLCQADWDWIDSNSDLDRWRVKNLKSRSPAIDTWLHQFSSTKTKLHLFEIAYNTESFLEYWARPDKKQFFNITRTYSEFIATPSKYLDHPWHQDSKIQIIQGMIFFDGHQFDNNRGTWFCIDSIQPDIFVDRNSPITKVPCMPGHGWLLINNDKSWHRGCNFSDHDRYSLKFGLAFDA